MLTGARPSFPSPGLGVHAWTAFLEPRWHSWSPGGFQAPASRASPCPALGESPLPPRIIRSFSSQALPLRCGNMVSWGLRVPVRGTQRPVW